MAHAVLWSPSPQPAGHRARSRFRPDAGLSLCACVAAAGEVNFHLLGFLLMTGASCSDAVRLVVAQKLLSNHRMQPVETLHVGRPL